MTAVQPTVLIAMPCLDHIKTPTVHSLFAASARLQAPAQLHLHQSAYVHDARNKSAEMAVEGGFTHIMFIDSDMQFPANSMQKLLELDKDIVGGLYYRRQVPHMPTLNVIEGDSIVIPTLDKYPMDKPFKIFSVATGFLMVKTSVFKKIPAPWFGFGKYKGKKEMGEDVFFCRKANDHGFEVWCDPTIPLGHVGEYTYTKQDYDAYQDLRPEKASGEFDGKL